MKPEPDLQTSSGQNVPAPTGFGFATLVTIIVKSHFCAQGGGEDALLKNYLHEKYIGTGTVHID